ncbi:MAG: DUF3810 domain-containing protein [Clostridia bacterium]|nr:DUF3810 domain-containing protein [Clostridia bacterium]
MAKRLWRFFLSLPKLLFVAVGLFLASLITHLCALAFPSVADFVNLRVASLFRSALGYISSVFPFSLAEIAIVLLPVFLFLLVFFAVRAARSKEKTKRMLAFLLSLLLLFYCLFVFTLGIGYASSPLEEKLGYQQTPVDGESLYQTALWLLYEAEHLAPEAIPNGEEGTKMPYSYQEMNKALLTGYKSLAEKTPFLSSMQVGTKPVALSSLMGYTQITGVYTFFTGEANVCVVYPDYSTVFTAAHEMAHARGIAREDEANFTAFLACISAKDSYIRYAGYLNMLQYVYNALYRADKSLYAKISLPPVIEAEFRAYNAVYDKYDNSGIGALSESINNAYLQAMGTQGTVSYGLVVNLAVSYYYEQNQ